MKNVCKKILLIALVSGMNSAPVMATAAAVQSAPHKSRFQSLKKVGNSIATNASSAGSGLKRFWNEQIWNKEKLGRNARIAALVTLLTAILAAGRTAYNDRGLDSEELAKENLWHRGSGRAFRGGEGKYDPRSRLFGHRVGTTGDTGLIKRRVVATAYNQRRGGTLEPFDKLSSKVQSELLSLHGSDDFDMRIRAESQLRHAQSQYKTLENTLGYALPAFQSLSPSEQFKLARELRENGSSAFVTAAQNLPKVKEAERQAKEYNDWYA